MRLVGPLLMTEHGQEHARPPSPENARVTTPAPLDLFSNYRKLPPTPLNWLKAARAAAVWRARPGLGKLTIAARLLGWLYRFPFDVARAMLTSASIWRREFDRSYWQQFLDLLVAAGVNGIMPRDYYRGDMARMQRRGMFFDVLPYQLYATPLVVVSMQRAAGVLTMLRNKWTCQQFLAGKGIPMPVTFAWISGKQDGREKASAFVPPRQDFLVKPAGGLQGQDVQIWRFDPAKDCWSRGGDCLDAAAMTSRLGDIARRMQGGMLVQEVLRNSERIAPFAPYALSTFRTVTILDEHGEPTVVMCQFRTSADPQSAVDNFHAGGCMFFVDLETGLFSRGAKGDFSVRPVFMDNHPVTGTRMEGVAVPDLQDVCRLAERAHRLVPDLPCIGWDIAHTQKGLVILEGNVPPGLQPTQQALAGGRIPRRFMALLAFHARTWIEQTEPENSRFRVGADMGPDSDLPELPGRP